MKKRRIAVIAFMLVAALTLGIGYAVLTDTLSIGADLTANTSGSAKEFDEDVKFLSVTPDAESAGKVSGEISADGDSITLSITEGALSTAGSSVKVTIVIENQSTEFDPTISAPAVAITGTDAAEFTVTTNWGTDPKVIDKSDGATHGQISFDLTITLNGSAVKARSARLDITFSATYNET